LEAAAPVRHTLAAASFIVPASPRLKAGNAPACSGAAGHQARIELCE
jgi:hypothetical protein